MHPFIIPFLLAFLLYLTPAIAKHLDCQVKAQSAIVMNADTGAILYEKNANQLYPPSSTTKIATALYAIKLKKHQLDEQLIALPEALKMTDEVSKRRAEFSLPPHWLEPDGTSLGLKLGEQMSLRDLLFGMMMVSGNDAANVIALHVGGTIPQFMNQLQLYLEKLGCKQTTFCNPHGLYHPKHMTTAYDLALLTREALKEPFFCEVVSRVNYSRPKTNKQESTTLTQFNRLLRKGNYFYPYAIGVKTGYTKIGKHAIVAAAKKEGRTLIAVLLKTSERKDKFIDAVKLFEAAFNESKVNRVLLQEGPQPYVLTLKEAQEPIETYLKAPITISYYPAEEPKLTCFLEWKTNLSFPIVQGHCVGEYRVLNEKNEVLLTAPLYAQKEVQATWWHWLFS
jgi:serine-type D-Ala-D-Ala carboxypeptidase (penicillin-binding protein 5/6)